MKTTRPTRFSIESRREFLKRSAAMSVVGTAAPFALNLAALGQAAAQTAGNDYKALVCVFLFGGNDYGNTLVPYDAASHAQYSSLRSTLTLARDTLAATELVPDVALPGGLSYALHPSMGSLKTLFDQGVMAPMLNVGPLVEPTSKTAYNARSVELPPKLFSHNDQQSVWQSSKAEGATSGWGGRMGDLFAAGNTQSVFTAVSVSGNAVYLSGESAVQYQVSSSGSIPITGIGANLFGSAAASQALRSVITQSGMPHVMQQSHAAVVQRSISADVSLRAALAAAPTLTTAFPTGGLGAQLNMVARMIAARNTLGAKRQVFFVSIGGFDMHDDLLQNHPGLLSQVADGMAAFYRATVELGVATNVTTFTASDFGRTLASNGDGSDHGWGSHHFVVGGAVRGKRYVGQAPALGNNGPDDVGQGRLLPTTAVDQFSSTLASWMGVSDTTIASTVVPGIARFSNRNVGLFA